MKTKTVPLALAALFVVLSITAWTGNQQAAQETRLITVTGDAEVRVVPDEVILTLGVETWDKEMETAKRQNDAIVSSVLDLTTEYDIEPQLVQTDFVHIEPRWRNGYYEERDFVGFFVRKTIVITLRDLNKFEGLLSGVLDAGVNHVQGIEFRTTELRQHRDEARALAIQAAREKAIALAGELGQTVGQPQMIQEVQSGWWSGYHSWWGSWGGTMAQNVIQETGGVGPAGQGGLAPGQISVNARVSVSFELAE